MGAYRIVATSNESSRGSAMECGALFDALRATELVDEPTHTEAEALPVRIVSTMC